MGNVLCVHVWHRRSDETWPCPHLGSSRLRSNPRSGSRWTVLGRGGRPPCPWVTPLACSPMLCAAWFSSAQPQRPSLAEPQLVKRLIHCTWSYAALDHCWKVKVCNKDLCPSSLQVVKWTAQERRDMLESVWKVCLGKLSTHHKTQTRTRIITSPLARFATPPPRFLSQSRRSPFACSFQPSYA